MTLPHHTQNNLIAVDRGIRLTYEMIRDELQECRDILKYPVSDIKRKYLQRLIEDLEIDIELVKPTN